MAASGIAVGLNKGHITTRRELKAKPSNKIGVRIDDGWIDYKSGYILFLEILPRIYKGKDNFKCFYRHV